MTGTHFSIKENGPLRKLGRLWSGTEGSMWAHTWLPHWQHPQAMSLPLTLGLGTRNSTSMTKRSQEFEEEGGPHPAAVNASNPVESFTLVPTLCH